MKFTKTKRCIKIVIGKITQNVWNWTNTRNTFKTTL